jgi:DNA-binding NarL/FixJ family response regulator
MATTSRQAVVGGLRTERLPARFIFLTVHNEPRLAAEAMGAGASGYLLKQSAGEELVAAIRAVASGGTYLTPLITKDVLWTMAASGGDDGPTLTPRRSRCCGRSRVAGA